MRSNIHCKTFSKNLKCLKTQLEDFIAKEDSKSKSESSSSRKSSLGSPISSDVEVNNTEAGEDDEVSFEDEPEIIEDDIEEVKISSDEKVSLNSVFLQRSKDRDFVSADWIKIKQVVLRSMVFSRLPCFLNSLYNMRISSLTDVSKSNSDITGY